MLGVGGELAFSQDNNGLHVTVPSLTPSIHASTFKIEGILTGSGKKINRTIANRGAN